MQIWKPCDKKLCHNDVISKNNRKVRTSEKPVKLYIIRKVLMIAIKKCKFDQIWVIESKVMDIWVKFWPFTTSIHQILLNHGTLGANFDKL